MARRLARSPSTMMTSRRTHPDWRGGEPKVTADGAGMTAFRDSTVFQPAPLLNGVVMSQMANRLPTRQQVIAALSQIIGLPLTAVRRVADMRTFQFGTLRPVDRGSVGDFAHLARRPAALPWRGGSTACRAARSS